MTRICMEKRGDRYKVECKDHATGSRDICTAVSTICQTLYGWVRGRKDVAILAQSVAPGEFRLEFYGGPAADIAFEVAAVGFLQAEATGPDFCQVTISEE